MLPTHRPPTHPGEMLLKEFLEPLGVSQVEAASRMNIPFQRLNAIVKGRRGVSADTALLLEALTRLGCQIWLTLQAKWDLWHAMKARGKRPKVRHCPRPRRSCHAAAVCPTPHEPAEHEVCAQLAEQPTAHQRVVSGYRRASPTTRRRDRGHRVLNFFRCSPSHSRPKAASGAFERCYVAHGQRYGLRAQDGDLLDRLANRVPLGWQASAVTSPESSTWYVLCRADDPQAPYRLTAGGDSLDRKPGSSRRARHVRAPRGPAGGGTRHRLALRSRGRRRRGTDRPSSCPAPASPARRRSCRHGSRRVGRTTPMSSRFSTAPEKCIRSPARCR